MELKTVKRNVLGLTLWILVSMSAGWIGSQFMPGEWYASLVKPAWNPPNAVFAPVWTTLYIMMGIGAWLVWREKGFSGAKGALILFFVQLGLNALWSYLFFGAHQPMWAFFDIIALWIAIILTMVVFWRLKPSAGILFIPYVCWVGFAVTLNFQLWRLNI